MIMKNNIKIKKENDFKPTAIEVLFWMMAIAVVLFINISPQALKSVNPAYLIIFLAALLSVLSANFLPSIKARASKIIFSIFIYLAVFFALLLFFKGSDMLLVFYYLPVVIAVTMAFIVIVQPKGPITMLVALCTFLLGEAFWNIHIGQGKRLIFPAPFMRVYSLSLIMLFAYYLYRREAGIKVEIRLLNQRLEKLNKMKSEFVANVSHELRTPLTSIKNACVILKKMDSYGQKLELLDIIDSNVDRQSRLVNNLLDLAKMEKGMPQAKRNLIDFGFVVKNVVKSLEMQAKNKSITLSLDVEPNLMKIFGSEDQISEVYTNLIDNAIKYTPAGGNVCIRLTNEKNNVKSVISDTGIGISEQDRGKLFDRFKRLEVILQKHGHGAGLGLAITKEIVDSHGGRIWVESKSGSGSSFIFTVPAGLRKGD